MLRLEGANSVSRLLEDIQPQGFQLQIKVTN